MRNVQGVPPTFAICAILPGHAVRAYRQRTILIGLAFLCLLQLVFPLFRFAIGALFGVLVLETRFPALHQVAHELLVGLAARGLGGQETVLDLLEHAVEGFGRGDAGIVAAIVEYVLDEDARGATQVVERGLHAGGRGGGGLD